MANDMQLLEVSTQSFIIKIWLEETQDEAGQALWRGHITHVPSGQRRYMEALDEIAAFIVPYLESMGVKIGESWPVEDWSQRARIYLARVFSRQPQEER